MLKKLSFALAAILSVSFLASCVINTSDDDGDDDVTIDYTSYNAPDYSIKVRNKTSKNVVCFKGIPSKDTLISGAHGGDVITNLKLNTALFNESSDFILYCVSEEDYKKFGNDYDSMAAQPLARIYAYFNSESKYRDNLVYDIASNLGGEFYFNLDNGTSYNFEIRMDGLYGAPLCYSGAHTLKTKVYAVADDYDLFPVLRQFDKRQGTIVTVYPQDNNGEPIYVPVSLNSKAKAVRLNCGDYVGQGIKTFASCAYLKISNGNAGGIGLLKGATAEPFINSTGVAYINSGDDCVYEIDMDDLGNGKYSTAVEVSGWFVGNRTKQVSIPDYTYEAGKMYTLKVKGTANQPTCEFSDIISEVSVEGLN